MNFQDRPSAGRKLVYANKKGPAKIAAFQYLGKFLSTCWMIIGGQIAANRFPSTKSNIVDLFGFPWPLYPTDYNELYATTAFVSFLGLNSFYVNLLPDFLNDPKSGEKNHLQKLAWHSEEHIACMRYSSAPRRRLAAAPFLVPLPVYLLIARRTTMAEPGVPTTMS